MNLEATRWPRLHTSFGWYSELARLRPSHIEVRWRWPHFTALQSLSTTAMLSTIRQLLIVEHTHQFNLHFGPARIIVAPTIGAGVVIVIVLVIV